MRRAAAPKCAMHLRICDTGGRTTPRPGADDGADGVPARPSADRPQQNRCASKTWRRRGRCGRCGRKKAYPFWLCRSRRPARARRHGRAASPHHGRAHPGGLVPSAGASAPADTSPSSLIKAWMHTLARRLWERLWERRPALACKLLIWKGFPARYGGGSGIRTPGTLARTTVFETAPIDRSGIPPRRRRGVARAPYLGPRRIDRKRPWPRAQNRPSARRIPGQRARRSRARSGSRSATACVIRLSREASGPVLSTNVPTLVMT